MVESETMCYMYYKIFVSQVETYFDKVKKFFRQETLGLLGNMDPR